MDGRFRIRYERQEGMGKEEMESLIEERTWIGRTVRRKKRRKRMKGKNKE